MPDAAIGLNAVIVAVTEEVPRPLAGLVRLLPLGGLAGRPSRGARPGDRSGAGAVGRLGGGAARPAGAAGALGDRLRPRRRRLGRRARPRTLRDPLRGRPGARGPEGSY